jgi:pimeloyl-ACP methyl ester carboxylesterase
MYGQRQAAGTAWRTREAEMPYAQGPGARLYVEETGEGQPILFVHEFSGDYRSWEPQVRYFSRRYRCVTYNVRGYPPSEVPRDVAAYSQAIAVEDAVAVLDHLGIDQAHVVGLSMGAFAALHLGLRHPERARSLVISGCGYGVVRGPGLQAQFEAAMDELAGAYETEGAAHAAATHAVGPGRVQLQNKDPRGWAEFAEQLAEHDPVGAALTLRGVQMRRPSLYDLEGELEALSVPTLILTGDEDEPCLEPGIFLKRTIRTSALSVIPRSGHTLNLEEPNLFNRILQDFFGLVEAGRWTPRDPRSLGAGMAGQGPSSE